MHPRLRPHRAAVPIVAVAVIVGGCSHRQGVDVEATPTFLATAASRSIQATTGRFTMTVGAGSASSEGATSEGAYDTRTRRMSVTVHPSAEVAAAAGALELVVDGATAYLRYPLLRDVVGTDKWVRLSAGDLASAGVTLGSFTAPPTADLDLLRGATDVTESGSDRVRGTRTTRLRATVDLAEAVDATPAGRRPLLEAVRRTFAASDTRTLPADVWIDGDGLVRRLRLRASAGAGTRATVTIDYYGYGDDVRISPPAAGEVSTVSPERLLSGIDDQGGR